MQAEGFDYIIIGGGSAGGMLTLRLSRNGTNRVLLLEAGLSDKHWTTRIPAAFRFTFTGGPRNWCFETEPEPHMNDRRLFQPRGKVLGGSSSLNGMVFVRGNRRDFDHWAEMGATGWSYEEVLPHFRSMETYLSGADEWHGGDGPIGVQKLDANHAIEDAFIEACVQAGLPQAPDYNGRDQEGASFFDANIRDGYRSATGRECIEPAQRRSNVTVRTQAHVTRVILEEGRAVGVEYRWRDAVHVARAEGEVILSAGAFQSPQLLMLSGIGPPAELDRHGIDVAVALDGVGQNLMDHLEVHVKHRAPRGSSNNKLMYKHRIVLAGLQWYLSRTGPAATTHSRVGAFFRLGPDSDYPDLQYHFWPYFLEGWSPPPQKDGYCFDVGPLRSESRGWVRLRSADPFAAPRIQINGLSSERDLTDFRDGIRLTREIAAQQAFDFCRGPEVDPGPETISDADIDAYVRANANSAYHPCGTCRMGRDELAVVDPELRVHGVDGLRVADASIMPQITAGNTNAPTMMIGEKAAAIILGDG